MALEAGIGGNRPGRPRALAIFISSRAFALWFWPAFALSPAFAQTTTPITLANITGMSEAGPLVRPVSLNGTGTLTPFGSAAVSFSGSQDQITGLTQGAFTFSLNRLDSFNVTGSPQIVSRTTMLSSSGSIAGGTGVFSGATGSVTYNFTYTGNASSSGTFTLTGTGSITVGATTTAITLTGFNGSAAVINVLNGTLQASPSGSVTPFGNATASFSAALNPLGGSGAIQGALTFTLDAKDSFVASFSAIFNPFSDAPITLPCTITGGTGIFSGATGSLSAVFTLSPNGTTYTLTGSGSITQPKAATSTTPVITSVATANGGSVVAQNTFIIIKGTNLVPANTPATGVIWNTAPSFASGLMPTQLGGVSVTFNNKPAFVYFYCSAATDPACSQDQLNILTPLDSTTGSVPVVVTSGAVSTLPFFANMQTVAPSFLLFDIVGHITATHADANYSLLGPPGLFTGATTTPARPSETIVLYAVGFGLPGSTLVNGSSTQSGSLPVFPVCQVGGNPAALTFAGLNGFPGLYQFNLTIPASAANGDNTLGCGYNGSATPAGNLITVQR